MFRSTTINRNQPPRPAMFSNKIKFDDLCVCLALVIYNLCRTNYNTLEEIKWDILFQQGSDSSAALKCALRACPISNLDWNKYPV
jgi:hypothetical protein